jgi:hypothetical protein
MLQLAVDVPFTPRVIRFHEHFDLTSARSSAFRLPLQSLSNGIRRT